MICSRKILKEAPRELFKKNKRRVEGNQKWQKMRKEGTEERCLHSFGTNCRKANTAFFLFFLFMVSGTNMSNMF